MNQEDRKLLEDNGWEVLCETPVIGIRHKDGSLASGQAVWMVLSALDDDFTVILEEKCPDS